MKLQSINFKELLLEQLKKFHESERWVDQDSPIRKKIPELWEVIDDPNTYKLFRKTKELSLLLEMTETLEENFNDEDWLPYELFGLKLDDARLFIGEVLEQTPKTEDTEITQCIKLCRDNILNKS